jgi:6-phosphogluconolactonase
MAADHMSANSAAQTRISDTPEQLAHEVAGWIVEQASQSRTRFSLCLSGGETPKHLYELLATPAYVAHMPWDRTHCFWGDERVVPRDDPRSNYHMAWDALLRHVPILAENIHAIPTEHMSPAAGAAAYATKLKRFYGADVLDSNRPLFDLTLLGLGEDGHIASLFPGSPALAETERWAVPVVGEIPPDRISLTYPVLASSDVTAFLVAGECKRGALAGVRASDPALPAARLKPHGAVYWFIDRAAAATPAFSGAQ